MVDKLKQHWLMIVIAALAVVGIFLFATGRVHAADKGGPPVSAANPFADAPIRSQSWTGVYFGVFGGWNAAGVEVTAPGGLDLNGLGLHGFSGGVALGGDIQVPGSCLVVGGRGSYEVGDTQFSISLGGPKASGSIKDGWSADGRIGCAMGTALPYFVFGYSERSTSTNIPLIPMPELKGWREGLGIEWRLFNLGVGTSFQPTLAVEWLHTQFDDAAINKIGIPTFKVQDDSFMAHVNFKLGAPSR